MKSFIMGKNEENVRLSRFVVNVTCNLPTSMLYKSFRNKRIKVNGKAGSAEQRLNIGDTVELYINDEFFAEKKASPKAKQPRLTIIYEDDNIAAIYKPAHLLCHSDRTGDASVVDAFIQYLTDKGEYIAVNENSFTPAICNRLDRGTEGIVLAAKNYAALRDMNEIIRTDLLLKNYLCITSGVPKKGRFIAYLKHFEKDNRVVIKPYAQNGYKEIITEVDIVNANPPLSLCKIGLITGRTHQIRAHLAFMGTPVLGDIKYGSAKMNDRYKMKTQCLCAVSVELKSIPPDNVLHYLSNKKIELKEPEILNTYNNLCE